MKNTLIIVIFLVGTILASKPVPLEEPSYETYTDDTQVVTLAQNQKFTLPITTRTITHRIETLPLNSNQCQFTSQSLLYKSLASSSLITFEQQVSDMLPLQKKQKIFLVDLDHNIISYSLDEHFLLKRLAPKTSIVGSNKKITTILLAATEDEEFVYYLTPEKYIVFPTESLGVEIIFEQKLEGNLIDIQKVIVYKGYFVILSRQSGLVIYKQDKGTKKLNLMQRIPAIKDIILADIEFDKMSQLLYVLSMNSPLIQIYHFNPSQFPEADKSFKIFDDYDSINLQSITNKHSQQNQEKNIHFDLTISSNRQQQTLMILFLHNYHNVIAELFYSPVQQNWKFVRYFKFSMRVNQIHIIRDVVLVVGSQSMGVFPYGIHPRLIEEQMNGIMTLTSIFRLKVLNNGQFVGITASTIEYGVIKLQQSAQVNCKIKEGSTLKSVKITANLTACTNQDRILYENYCTYQKTFMIEEMGLTVSAPIANTIWGGLLIFLIAIIIGLCILFAMQKKKEKQIKKLELYFQQRQKHQPSPSDRRTVSNI